MGDVSEAEVECARGGRGWGRRSYADRRPQSFGNGWRMKEYTVHLQPDLPDWPNMSRRGREKGGTVDCLSCKLLGFPPQFEFFPRIPHQVPSKPTTAFKQGAGGIEAPTCNLSLDGHVPFHTG